MSNPLYYLLIGALLCVLGGILWEWCKELRISIAWPITGITGLIVMYNLGLIPTGSL